ncbi:C40 family peptidase [Actinoallomurus spadix]|uniref:NlpC/P60 domain-containing protein n=1 Tax=Actinoallomurus spadix TaxID=79912 RepID=A0ABN0W4M1_9ACTN|nr:C40 family peptidase [Actinoallomurus spadix]MCO5985670.1 C40 family peptidase [Actinoallomurus spadix]
MVAAGAVLAPVALTATAAHAAAPQTAVTVAKAQTKHKSWSQRHKVGLKAVTTARKQIGKWYRYGGAGPRNFDCSGLVQYSYRKAGVRLPRTAGQQHRHIKRHVRWKNLAAGDLVYFNGNNHTGIISKVVGHKIYMIHASHTGTRIKQVRIDNNSYYRGHFYGAARPY